MANSNENVVHGRLRDVKVNEAGEKQITDIMPENEAGDVLLDKGLDSHVMSLIDKENSDKATLRDVLSKIKDLAFEDKETILEEVKKLLPEEGSMTDSADLVDSTVTASATAAYNAKRQAVNLNGKNPTNNTLIYAPDTSGEGVPYFNEETKEWEWGHITDENIDDWNRILEDSNASVIDSLNFTESINGSELELCDVKYIGDDIYVMLFQDRYYVYDSNTGSVQSYSFDYTSTSNNAHLSSFLILCDNYLTGKKELYAVIDNGGVISRISTDDYSNKTIFSFTGDASTYTIPESMTGIIDAFPYYAEDGTLTVLGYSGTLGSTSTHYFMNISKVNSNSSTHPMYLTDDDYDVFIQGNANNGYMSKFFNNVSYDEETNTINQIVCATGYTDLNKTQPAIRYVTYNGTSIITYTCISDSQHTPCTNMDFKPVENFELSGEKNSGILTMAFVYLDANNKVTTLTLEKETAGEIQTTLQCSSTAVSSTEATNFGKIEKFLFVPKSSFEDISSLNDGYLISDFDYFISDVESDNPSEMGLETSTNQYHLLFLNDVIYRFTKQYPFELYQCEIDIIDGTVALINDPCTLYFNSMDASDYFSNSGYEWTIGSISQKMYGFYYINDLVVCSIPFTKSEYFNGDYSETVFTSKIQKIQTFSDIITYIERAQRTFHNQNIKKLTEDVSVLKSYHKSGGASVVIGIEGNYDESMCDLLVSDNFTFDDALNEALNRCNNNDLINTIYVRAGIYTIKEKHQCTMSSSLTITGDGKSKTIIHVSAPGISTIELTSLNSTDTTLAFSNIKIGNQNTYITMTSSGHGMIFDIEGFSNVSFDDVYLELYSGFASVASATSLRPFFKTSPVSLIDISVNEGRAVSVDIHNTSITITDDAVISSYGFNLGRNCTLTIDENSRVLMSATNSEISDFSPLFEMRLFNNVNSPTNDGTILDPQIFIRDTTIKIGGRAAYADRVPTTSRDESGNYYRDSNNRFYSTLVSDSNVFLIDGCIISCTGGGSITMGSDSVITSSVIRNTSLDYVVSNRNLYLGASRCENVNITLSPLGTADIENLDTNGYTIGEVVFKENAAVLGCYVDGYYVNLSKYIRIAGSYINSNPGVDITNSVEETSASDFIVTNNGYHLKGENKYGLVSATALDGNDEWQPIQSSIHVSKTDPGDRMQPGDLWFKIPDTD